MAEGERRFDVVGIILVLVGLAYAGIAIYLGTNTAWSPHTDYYIQQIVGVTGSYLWMAPSSQESGLQAILRANGRYVYVHLAPDGLVKGAYVLPDMNFVGATVYKGHTYLVSADGHFIDLYVVYGSKLRHYRYYCDLWALRPLSAPQRGAGSPIFYFAGSWQGHSGVLRVDFADLNSPEARVFYDIPTSAVVRYANVIYFTGSDGFVRDVDLTGKSVTVYKTAIRADPVDAGDGTVAVLSGERAGVVYLSGNSANAFLLDGIRASSAVVTEFGAFVSAPSGIYVISGRDKNDLRIYFSDSPLVLEGYLQNPADYEIYGSYAHDPAYIRGSFDFPRCPVNFAPVYANVTYIIAPRERAGKIVGVLTPLELNATSPLLLRQVSLHTDFPCYHQ
ncbi:MAG: hypothetical protein GXN93_03710 [Candidatus Diapherotrites archaeon]|nr:hypothetical protein [Candidatus Diapherotrites archaeon]